MSIDIRDVRLGDKVTVRNDGHSPLTGTVEILRPDGNLYTVSGAIALYDPSDEWVNPNVTVLSHEPKRNRIAFEDTIHHFHHFDRYEIPVGTKFVDRDGDIVAAYDGQDGGVDLPNEDYVETWGPLVCIYVPREES